MAKIVKENDTTFVHFETEDKGGPLIFLVPGNPGICEYYVEFVNELASQLPGHEIVAPSHNGYNLESPAGVFNDRSYNLEEQIKHKIDFLNSRVLEPRKVILLGHSVGAWMVQRVAMHFSTSERVRIEFVGLLTPTVQDIAKSDRGSRLVSASKYVSARFLASSLRVLYYVVPNMVWKFFVKSLFRKSQSPDFVRLITLKYIQRPSIVYQTLTLGAEEMERITDSDPKEIEGFWDSNKFTIWGFFAQHDHWVAPDTRQALIDRYGSKPNVHFEIVPDESIPHAFCINASDAAAKYVAAAIKKFETPVKPSLEASIETLGASVPGSVKSPSPPVNPPRSRSSAPPSAVSTPVKPKSEVKHAGTKTTPSQGTRTVSSASGAHMERESTPGASPKGELDGSQTPKSTHSKESGVRRPSVRKLTRALSRKKKSDK